MYNLLLVYHETKENKKIKIEKDEYSPEQSHEDEEELVNHEPELAIAFQEKDMLCNRSWLGGHEFETNPRFVREERRAR